MYQFSPHFKGALIKNPKERCNAEIDIIFSHLRKLDGFEYISDTALKKISRAARFEAYPDNYVLFRKGQSATCWYILLSGSVYIDAQIQLPFGCFGKRNEIHLRRISDCIIVQSAELIAIDYPDVQRVPIYQTVHEAVGNNVQNKFNANVQIRSTGTRFDDQLDTPYFNTSHKQPAPPRPSYQPPTYATIEGNHFSIDEIDRHKMPPPPPPSVGISRITIQPYHQQSKSSSNGIPSSNEARHPIPMLRHSFQSNTPVKMADNSSTGPFQTHQTNNPPPYVRYRTHNSHLQRKSLDETGMCSKEKVPLMNGLKQPTLISVGSSNGSSCHENDELSGLPEAFVDSDDEDGSCPSHDSFQELRDNVRECLEKEPSMRTADDIHILLDFMAQMQAFARLPMSIRRQLCLKMLFAVVSEQGTVILQDGDKLDSWSVVVNGFVEWTKPNGEKTEYRMGDAFGAHPNSSVQYHEGEMRTLVKNCEFVLVEHKDFYHIMSTISEHINKVADVTGEVISEIERRVTGSQVGLVIIKAKAEKLIHLLVDELEAASDAHYIEDFLLMYRVFISQPTIIFLKLLEWFEDKELRERVPRIILLWVNTHFNDFEGNAEMMNMLEQFGELLEVRGMQSQLALLNIASSVKSKLRTVTITRSNRDQELSFTLIGGKETNNKIFVANVSPNSNSEVAGLRRGDEILEVNGHNYSQLTLARALVLLKDSTHLSVQVKWNLLGFKQMLFDLESKNSYRDYNNSPSHEKHSSPGRYVKKNDKNGINGLPSKQSNSSSSSVNTKVSSSSSKSSMMNKLMGMIKGSTNSYETGYNDDNLKSMNVSSIDPSLPPLSGTMRASRSNPDIHSNLQNGLLPSHKASLGASFALNGGKNGYVPAEQVIKVYRSDQTFRFLTIYIDTPVKNVVQLALQEFSMNNDGSSMEWSLCMTSVTAEGAIKQRTLPSEMANLSNYLNLNSRYYLKNNDRSEPLLPDDAVSEVLKETLTSAVDLNAHTLAIHLTLQDFNIFNSIEATEYVDCLFDLDSNYGWPKLKKFEEIFNAEMWWVATEVCSEKVVYKRTKLIKKFIKVARHCRELRNFNSMFAILSGLEKPAVRRLQNSWERVPSKYVKMLNDMQSLLDPSRNMSKYRQHLINCSQDPPVIPIYPVFKKDLIYSHEANPTYCDKLVNFEKLRIIAKIIKSVTKLSIIPFTPEVLFERDSSNLGQNGGTSTMKRIGGMAKSSSQSRKKLYEQELMVKKVKAYLEEMKICDNENELDKMSYDCEPPQNASSGTASTGTSRRRAPSPSSSSISSHSNQSEQLPRFHGPKFGVESPQAVQKMLSLVQNSRVKSSNNSKGVSPINSPMMSNRSTASKRSNPTVGRIPSFSSRGSTNSADIIHPVDLTAESSSVTNFYSNNGNSKVSSTNDTTEIGPGAFIRPFRRK